MRSRALVLAWIACLGLLPVGCRAPGSAVIVSRTSLDGVTGEAPVHVHTAHCGHYLDGTVWRRLPGHVHGPGCGHVWRDGAWRLP